MKDKSKYKAATPKNSFLTNWLKKSVAKKSEETQPIILDQPSETDKENRSIPDSKDQQKEKSIPKAPIQKPELQFKVRI